MRSIEKGWGGKWVGSEGKRREETNTPKGGHIGSGGARVYAFPRTKWGSLMHREGDGEVNPIQAPVKGGKGKWREG